MNETWHILALKYLKFRPRSIKEIRDYLTRKQVPPEQAEKIIQDLIYKKFLNDEEFARAWIRSRVLLKPKSKRMLRLELIQKGIAKEIIDRVIEQVQDESGNDEKMAKELLLKRNVKYAGMEPNERYRKAGGYLSRRGFSYDTIKKSIDEIFGQ